MPQTMTRRRRWSCTEISPTGTPRVTSARGLWDLGKRVVAVLLAVVLFAAIGVARLGGTPAVADTSGCASLRKAANLAILRWSVQLLESSGTSISGRIAAAGDVTLDGVSVDPAAGRVELPDDRRGRQLHRRDDDPRRNRERWRAIRGHEQRHRDSAGQRRAHERRATVFVRLRVRVAQGAERLARQPFPDAGSDGVSRLRRAHADRHRDRPERVHGRRRAARRRPGS